MTTIFQPSGRVVFSCSSLPGLFLSRHFLETLLNGLEAVSPPGQPQFGAWADLRERSDLMHLGRIPLDRFAATDG